MNWSPSARRMAIWLAALAACLLAITALLRGRPGARSDVRPSAGADRVDANAGPALSPAAGKQVPADASSSDSPILLHDVTPQTGVTFCHTDGGSGRRYIMETVSAGLALFDADGDGLIDIYFLSGRPLPGAEGAAPGGNALYRNLGAWRFADITAKAGVGQAGYGLAVAVGDYDNDGHPDLYVVNYGANVLYHNNGDGTFADVTRRAGVAGAGQVGAGACFLDADGDGRLDLFVANYLKFSYEDHATVTVRGLPTYASPNRYPPLPAILYHNNGDGTFTDVSRESGIARHAGWGMGIVAADVDGDGDTDIFVLNDGAPNFLWLNDGAGRFEEVGAESGLAYDLYGSPQGSMGVDCGDYDHDGRLDFYHTSYQSQHAVLLRNLGGGLFEDVSLATGAAAGTYAHVTWGCGFVDFANRGRRDIFVARGHLQDNVEQYDTTTSYRAGNLVLANRGDGTFADVSGQAGDGLQSRHSSRGAAFDDLDNDGDVDVVVLNSREPPTILRNMLQERGSHNHWIQVELRGVKTNRDGVGARVKVAAGDLVQIDEVHAGRGYQSHYGTRLYFGIGSHKRVDRVEVRWIGGGVDVIEDLAPDRRIVITEGRGAAAK